TGSPAPARTETAPAPGRRWRSRARWDGPVGAPGSPARARTGAGSARPCLAAPAHLPEGQLEPGSAGEDHAETFGQGGRWRPGELVEALAEGGDEVAERLPAPVLDPGVVDGVGRAALGHGGPGVQVGALGGVQGGQALQGAVVGGAS